MAGFEKHWIARYETETLHCHGNNLAKLGSIIIDKFSMNLSSFYVVDSNLLFLQHFRIFFCGNQCFVNIIYLNVYFVSKCPPLGCVFARRCRGAALSRVLE